MVAITPVTTSAISAGPSPISSSTEIRAPSSATPIRSTVREVKATPGAQRPSSARKWNAIPSSSAISMAGAP